MRAALRANGYAADQIDAIISTCGLRLRKLNPFLAESAGTLNVAGELSTVVKDVRTNLSSLFAGLDSKDRKALAKVMDDLCAGKAVLSRRLPTTIGSPLNNTVFYLREGSALQLQSAAVRKAWEDARVQLQ